MKKFAEKILSIFLAAVMIFGNAGTVFAAESEEQSLEEIIRPQIEAFAKSIDQEDADGKAADALAMHGMFKNGKDLNVGEDHALTATLVNSELVKFGLTKMCLNAIKSMQGLDLAEMPYISGSCGWYESNYYYDVYNKLSEEDSIENKDWRITPKGKYSGDLNKYDSSLLWMVGNATIKASIEQTNITETNVLYKITCTISDRFDFNTSTGGGFKDLISGIGAIFFDEFDWHSTISFNINVPHSCNHKTGMYHWIYDDENKTLISDDSNGYVSNNVTRHEYESGKGAYQTFEETSYYYELDETIRLYHSKPWVIEYDIKNPKYFVFSPLENYAAKSKLSLLHAGTDNAFFWTTEYFEISEEERKENNLGSREQLLRNYSGINFDGFFSYSTEKMYTFTFENNVY
ncbi:MAG: hypothetical protein IJ306_02725, partial [Oscillospiraceae bacterium]|nr:hypothetical protein [Oscillospiraceae bacterium]